MVTRPGMDRATARTAECGRMMVAPLSPQWRSRPKRAPGAGHGHRNPGARQRLTALFTALLMAWPGAAAAEDHGETERWRKALTANAAAAAAVLTYGAFAWDYGSESFNVASEGYFGGDTRHGGADKVGHAYTGYAFGRGFAHAYESWGYTHERSAAFGALSSLGLTTLIEIGDGFSAYGLSPEDLVMNSAGALGAWALHRSPALARRLDFRVSWEPSFGQGDIVTDYDHLKYLLALKLNGFESLGDSPLRWVELHVGFYTRGYQDSDDTRRQNLFVGIGLNLSELLTRAGWRRTGVFLQYFQPPGTSLEYARQP